MPPFEIDLFGSAKSDAFNAPALPARPGTGAFGTIGAGLLDLSQLIASRGLKAGGNLQALNEQDLAREKLGLIEKQIKISREKADHDQFMDLLKLPGPQRSAVLPSYMEKWGVDLKSPEGKAKLALFKSMDDETAGELAKEFSKLGVSGKMLAMLPLSEQIKLYAQFSAQRQKQADEMKRKGFLETPPTTEAPEGGVRGVPGFAEELERRKRMESAAAAEEQARQKVVPIPPGGSLVRPGVAAPAGPSAPGPSSQATPIFQSPSPAPGTQEREFNKVFVKRYEDFRNRANEAFSMNIQLDDIGGMLEEVNKSIGTGAFAEAKNKVMRAVKAAGYRPEDLGITDSTGAADAANALRNRFALRLRNPDSGLGLTGNTSDRDVQFLLSGVPGIGLTPEGNKLLISTLKKFNEREIKLNEMAIDYAQKNGGLDVGFDRMVYEYNTKHQVVSKADADKLRALAKKAETAQSTTDAPVRVGTPEEAQKLKPGTLYMAPDGAIRRR